MIARTPDRTGRERGERRRPACRARALTAATLMIAAAAPALALGAGAWSQRVAVSVPWHPPTEQPVAVSFRPHAPLPRHGYYYAVAVLEHYRVVRAREPRCAVSSDMSRTEYGHAGRDGRVRLRLLPDPAGTGRWCAGGIYEGAVYAVPHPPPCTRAYPCYGRSTCGPAGGVCGVVVHTHEYSYPGGLPKPVDASTRIIGHFTFHAVAATG